MDFKKEINKTRKFQSRQSIKINAPIEVVWEYNQDLSKISEFHPRVTHVDLLTNDKFRKAGATYKCYLKNGKHNCTERDIEVVPMNKIVTSLPEDTMGLSKILKNYIVETNFKKIDDESTEMEFIHFYNTPGIIRHLLNFIIKPKISKEAQKTLQAIKSNIEKSFTTDNKQNYES